MRCLQLTILSCPRLPFLVARGTPFTEFNMARSEDTREHWERIRAEHMPMLWWMADTAKNRISKGRIVLLEQGWRCLSLTLKCFVDLIGLEDGVDDEAYFEFVR